MTEQISRDLEDMAQHPILSLITFLLTIFICFIPFGIGIFVFIKIVR